MRCPQVKKRTLKSKRQKEREINKKKGEMCCWQHRSVGFDLSAHIVTHNLSTATFTFQTHGERESGGQLGGGGETEGQKVSEDRK